MKLNKPLVALLIGALATIPQEIYTRFSRYFLGIGDYSVYELNSLIITVNRPSAILGIVSTCMVGGIVSILLYYSLNRIGPDYIILKSIVSGIISWVISEAIFTWLLEGPKLIQVRSMSDYFLQVTGALVYGVMLGLLYKRYITPINT